ncbi:cathelicidin-2-like [Pelodiscus sinensis]|uniref:cathelicidin-2-like n=1 Tax=Pelodiscus sinensis TaxID=13735 RepID=UPI003F6BA710
MRKGQEDCGGLVTNMVRAMIERTVNNCSWDDLEDGNSPGVRALHFLVKETVCLGSERAAMEECDFKEDGRVRRCSGYVSSEQGPATILITCDPAAEAPARVRRASCGRPYKTPRQPTRHVRRHRRMTAGRK